MDLEVEELTPRGRGAVSVVRLRGSHALPAARELTGAPALAPGALRTVRLRIGLEDVDEAIVCVRSASEVELHVHGSPPILQRLLDDLRESPARATVRQSLEACAARRLANAPCEAAARILLDQAEGALTRVLRALPSMDPAGRERAIAQLLENWRAARFALEPAEVVLAGPVNSGKSTLFNVLLGDRRAIVAAGPGTTRDVLRERAYLGAWPVWLLDTAGERDPATGGVAGPIEAEGRERGRKARRGADLVVWIEPCGAARSVARPRSEGGPEDDRWVHVSTFADLHPGQDGSRDAISALHDPAGARARVVELFRSALTLRLDPWDPGAPVPFTSELAGAVAGLRDGERLEQRVDALIASELAIA